MKGITGGILRGAGKQMVGALCNLVGYYLFGVPIGVSLMFAAHMSVEGRTASVEAPFRLSGLSQTVRVVCRAVDGTHSLCVHAVHFLLDISVETELEESFRGGVYLHLQPESLGVFLMCAACF